MKLQSRMIEPPGRRKHAGKPSGRGTQAEEWMTPGDGDWTEDVLDRLDRAIEVVRSNTADRLRRIAELLIYGVVAGVTGSMALVLLVIGTIRLLDVLLPSMWVADLLLGTALLGCGLLLWSKRMSPASSPTGVIEVPAPAVDDAIDLLDVHDKRPPLDAC